ncbi:MAG TPA: BrnT family toxin [Tepidisphaeraceae bacterium]|jgi:hypothetical protein
MRFDWDAGKSKSNLAKHNVSFQEASETFFDPLVVLIPDEAHSTDAEDRWIAIGLSTKRRVLFVVHAYRDEEVVWIISARRASRQEVNDYEDEIKERLGWWPPGRPRHSARDT